MVSSVFLSYRTSPLCFRLVLTECWVYLYIKLYRHTEGLGCRYLAPERISFYLYYMARDNSIKDHYNPFQGTETISNSSSVPQETLCRPWIILQLWSFAVPTQSMQAFKEIFLGKPELNFPHPYGISIVLWTAFQLLLRKSAGALGKIGPKCLAHFSRFPSFLEPWFSHLYCFWYFQVDDAYIYIAFLVVIAKRVSLNYTDHHYLARDTGFINLYFTVLFLSESATSVFEVKILLVHIHHAWGMFTTPGHGHWMLVTSFSFPSSNHCKNSKTWEAYRATIKR